MIQMQKRASCLSILIFLTCTIAVNVAIINAIENEIIVNGIVTVRPGINIVLKEDAIIAQTRSDILRQKYRTK